MGLSYEEGSYVILGVLDHKWLNAVIGRLSNLEILESRLPVKIQAYSPVTSACLCFGLMIFFLICFVFDFLLEWLLRLLIIYLVVSCHAFVELDPSKWSLPHYKL